MLPIEPVEKRSMNKARAWGNLAQVLLGLPIAFMLFYYSPALGEFVTGQPTPSFPISILQPGTVALVYVLAMATFAHLMARFNERMFRINAFGTWSRYGVLYLCFFFGLVFLSALMMGAFPS